MIIDGAFSDSELDRHRDTPEPVSLFSTSFLLEICINFMKHVKLIVERKFHYKFQHKTEVVVWKWGELPRTLEETEKAKKQEDVKTEQEKKESTWGGWFRWSRAKPIEDQGVYLDDLVQNASDPGKIEKYLGMSPPTAW